MEVPVVLNSRPTPQASHKRPTEAKWIKYRVLLERLFVEENKTVPEIVKYMRERYDLEASPQQYTRKFKSWGLQKNKPQSRWTRLPGQLKRKGVDVEHAEVWDKGVLQDRKRVKKYLSRNNTLTSIFQESLGTINAANLKHGLKDEAWAPAPDDDLFVRVALTPRVQLSTPKTLPWFDFIRALDTKSYEMGIVPIPFSSNRSHGVVFDPEELMSSDLQVQPRGPTTMSQHVAKRLPSPYVEALASLTAKFAADRQKSMDLRSVSSPEMQFNLAFEAFLPADIPGDLNIDPKALFQNPSDRNLQVAAAYLAYFTSNNIGPDKLSLFAIISKIPSMVRYLSASHNPSAKALSQDLFGYAIRQLDFETLKTFRSVGYDFNTPIRVVGALSPLQYALLECDFRAISSNRTGGLLKFLLESGANPNQCYEHGSFEANGKPACCFGLPIIRAFDAGEFAVEALIAAGCRVPCDFDLMRAIEEHYSFDTLQELLSYFNFNAWRSRDEIELCPLKAAVDYCNEELVAILLQGGVNPKSEMSYRGQLRHLRDNDHYCDTDEDKSSDYEDELAPCDLPEELDVFMLRSPLTTSILKRSSSITQLLLAAGADVTWCRLNDVGENHLCNHAFDYHKLYLHCYGEEDVEDHAPVLNALQAAVYIGDVDLLELLSNQCPTLECRRGTPLIVLAALSGHQHMVQYLLNRGSDLSEVENELPAEVEERPRRRLSALGAAASKGDISMMSLLLTAGANVNQPPTQFGALSPLQAAVYFHQHESILFLCQNGADISLPGAEIDGLSAIAAAVHVGNFQAFEYLLHRGSHCTSAMVDAVGAKDDRYFHMLHQRGCSIDESQVVVASIEHNYCFFRLVNAGVNLKKVVHGETLADIALRQAVKTRAITVLHWLVEKCYFLSQESLLQSLQSLAKDPGKGTDADMKVFLVCTRALRHTVTRDEYVERPQALGILLYAQRRCQNRGCSWDKKMDSSTSEVVNILIEHGASLNAFYESMTPLQHAIQGGLNHVRKVLIDGGADVNQRENESMCTSLQLAVDEENLDLVKTLLLRGANVDVNMSGPDDPYYTGFPRHMPQKGALQQACYSGEMEMVSLLLDNGANVNATPYGDKTITALQCACYSGRYSGIVQILYLLIRHGADVNAAASRISQGRTALQVASEKGHVEIVNLLINHGADVNQPAGPRRGVTALQAASMKGFLRIVQILIAAGADVAAPGSAIEGRTAIDGAAEHGKHDVLKYLLDEYKGDEAISVICDRATKYARKEGHLGALQVLKDYCRSPE